MYEEKCILLEFYPSESNFREIQIKGETERARRKTCQHQCLAAKIEYEVQSIY
jgi:hypothetical protein